jgi:DNA-directed RNA polymerase subunit E'
MVKIRDKVRLPPDRFGKNIDECLKQLAQDEYEGLVRENLGVIVAVTDIKRVSEGRVVPGDGAAYFDAEIEMLVFKPEVHEVVEAKVGEIAEFGAFLSLGPMEGLVHVSQIMDEYLNYDSKNMQFIGKESKKTLKVDDTVLARIVSVSLKGTLAESKIGLTMRQPFLGKKEWEEIDKKMEKKKKKAAAKKEEGKKDKGRKK